MIRIVPFVAVAWATVAVAQTAGLSREALNEMLPADAVIHPLDVRPKWIDRPGPGVYWKQTSPIGVRAKYYALHFAGLHDQSGAAWRFRVLDGEGRELMSFGPSDNRAGDFWTEDLHADQLVFVVESDRKPTGLTFTIDRWLIADPKPLVRSIVVKSDPKIEAIKKYEQDAGVWIPGRAVAKLTIKDGTKRYSCTGFLIAKDMLLTNEHCIPTAMPVRKKGVCTDAIQALFNYVVVDTRPSPYSCAELLAKDAHLDYAVLRLAGSPGDSWGMLPLEGGRNPTGGMGGEPLRLIQHPGGRVKAVAIKRCRAERVAIVGVRGGGGDQGAAGGAPGGVMGDDQDFEHICDTEGGSSGSPVLDAAGRVIGLHHFGFFEDAVVRVNQAVLMTRIVASFTNDIRAALVP